jgi:hypothetical protein
MDLDYEYDTKNRSGVDLSDPQLEDAWTNVKLGNHDW